MLNVIGLSSTGAFNSRSGIGSLVPVAFQAKASLHAANLGHVWYAVTLQ